MKVTWDVFVYAFKFICFDESYLRCFCLCFKCLEFFHKKLIILITNFPDNLNIYTTNNKQDNEWFSSFLDKSDIRGKLTIMI